MEAGFCVEKIRGFPRSLKTEAILWNIVAQYVNFTCAFQSRTGKTVYTETLPCDVAKFEVGRDKARYDSYGMCVLYNTDVKIFAKIEGLDEYKERNRVSYKWKSKKPEIDGETTKSVQYTAPNNEKEEISVDIFVYTKGL